VEARVRDDAHEGTRLRVVLVDDTADLRQLLRIVLERTPDFEVVGEAADGREGVEVARDQQPDLVLLDITMPVMDGLEALPLIRAASPGSAVVVHSVIGATTMLRRVLEAGAADYVPKGTPLPVLLSRLRDVASRGPA
jgi:DNA-binding NarL/FixJ family response regulator